MSVIERLNTLERLKYKGMEIKLAGDFGKYTTMEISADDIAKLLAAIEAGDEIFSYLKAYRCEYGPRRVGQVPPGFEYKMHDAMERWAKARAALREETK